ncbi:MAG: hypothetical protein B5M53_08965 [Candidatus Cloacimonas sp. 4484_209]|nr:MAG: hypothetical protein B5M53_08965 [Candidatus Cloacimonas sp. 4484_209]
MNKPLVSIITPTFNYGEFIEDTLLSVQMQNYPYIEHIVVDGGSTDNTISILKKYESRYNLKWVSEPDKGVADAANKGLKMAKGEIIGWLWSDDVYLYKTTVSEAVEFLCNYPNVDVVYGNLVIFNKYGIISRIQIFPKFSYKLLLRRCCIGQSAAFWRRKYNQSYGLDKSLQLAIDYAFWLKLAKSHSFMHVNKLWAGDRNHDRRKTVTQIKKLQEEKEKVSSNNQKIAQNIFVKYWDKFTIGIPSRILGLLYFRKLKKSQKNFTVNLKFDNWYSFTYKQLFKKNHEI